MCAPLPRLPLALSSSDLQSIGAPLRSAGEGPWRGVAEQLPAYAIALVLLVATSMMASIVSWTLDRVVARLRLRASQHEAFLRLAYAATWFAGLVVASSIAFPGLNPTKLVISLGIVSLMIGAFCKDDLENVFAGLLIRWRFPFEPGDYVEVDGISGRVEGTTLRTTAMRQADGRKAVVANALLFKHPVRISAALDLRRASIACFLDYRGSLEVARQRIADAVRSCSTVSDEEDVEVVARTSGAGSVAIEVIWWTGSGPVDVRRSRDEVYTAVVTALDEQVIEAPAQRRGLALERPLQIA